MLGTMLRCMPSCIPTSDSCCNFLHAILEVPVLGTCAGVCLQESSASAWYASILEFRFSFETGVTGHGAWHQQEFDFEHVTHPE